MIENPEERRKDEQKFLWEYMRQFSETEGRVFSEESIRAALEEFPALKIVKKEGRR